MNEPKLSFFWIAEYSNNQVLPQFDFKTGKENLFSEIDQNKLVKFGWYPFPLSLSKLVNGAIYNPILSNYILNIRPIDKLFACRRNYIQRDGRTEKRYSEYILGNQDFILVINENGNVEVKYDRN